MRIIGEIEHPRLKISIFKSDNKLAVKFENGLLEQTYKFRVGYPTETVEDIEKMIDADFTEKVEQMLESMQVIRLNAFLNHFKEVESDEFPRII
jgi:hypothetical protein